MLIPAENEFDLAVQKLEETGFRHAPWSYATVDPGILKKRDDYEKVQKNARILHKRTQNAGCALDVLHISS